jgi:hypothetical protein
MSEYEHTGIPLTEEQMDMIAERAARKALEIVYAEVGKSVLKKLAWLVGIIVVGIAMWLAGKGHLPVGE